MKIFQKADFINLQDDYVMIAKEQLSRDKWYPGFSFIMAAKETIESAKGVKIADVDDLLDMPEGKKPFEVAKAPQEVFKNFESPEDKIIMLATPNNLDPEEALQVILNTQPSKEAKEEMEQKVKQLLSMSKQIGLSFDEAIYQIYRAMLAVLNAHPHDITTLALKEICSRVDAYGILKIDEGWYTERKTSEVSIDDLEKEAAKKDTLADDPNALECIVSMLETISFHRTVIVPFTREERGKNQSPIKSFGEPRISEVSRAEMEETMRGRFVGLLKKIEGLA